MCIVYVAPLLHNNGLLSGSHSSDCSWDIHVLAVAYMYINIIQINIQNLGHTCMYTSIPYCNTLGFQTLSKRVRETILHSLFSERQIKQIEKCNEMTSWLTDAVVNNNHGHPLATHSIMCAVLFSRMWLVRIHGRDISMGNWIRTPMVSSR